MSSDGGGGDNGSGHGDGGSSSDGSDGYGGFGGLGIGNPGSYGGQDSVGAPGGTGGADVSPDYAGDFSGLPDTSLEGAKALGEVLGKAMKAGYIDADTANARVASQGFGWMGTAVANFNGMVASLPGAIKSGFSLMGVGSVTTAAIGFASIASAISGQGMFGAGPAEADQDGGDAKTQFDALVAQGETYAAKNNIDVNNFISGSATETDGATEMDTTTRDNKDLVTSAFKELFDRTPTDGGVDYWTEALSDDASGVTKDTLNQALLNGASPSDKDAYTSGLTAKVEAAYKELFGREPTQAGINYWVDKMNDPNSGITIDNYRQAIINGASTDDKAAYNELWQDGGGTTVLPEAPAFDVDQDIWDQYLDKAATDLPGLLQDNADFRATEADTTVSAVSDANAANTAVLEQLQSDLTNSQGTFTPTQTKWGTYQPNSNFIQAKSLTSLADGIRDNALNTADAQYSTIGDRSPANSALEYLATLQELAETDKNFELDKYRADLGLEASTYSTDANTANTAANIEANETGTLSNIVSAVNASKGLWDLGSSIFG